MNTIFLYTMDGGVRQVDINGLHTIADVLQAALGYLPEARQVRVDCVQHVDLNQPVRAGSIIEVLDAAVAEKGVTAG